MEFQPNVAIRSLLMKLDEKNENCKPLLVIVNAGVCFNILEEVNRIIVNSLDQNLQLLHSVNKVVQNISEMRIFNNKIYINNFYFA